MDTFRKKVFTYYHKHKRKMPWRDDPNPYWVVVSELMLQQTQVSRVMEKFPLFIFSFPSFELLAKADTRELLALWSGLGYNRRALYLREIARRVVNDYGGKLPSSPEELINLPGIGLGTVGSIRAFAFNQPSVFIETNIRRVFIHAFFPDREGVTDAQILPLVAKSVPKKKPREWYYALMDYGAYLKTVVENPNRKSKHYIKQSKFEGSRRQMRGRILKELAEKGSIKLSRVKGFSPKNPLLVEEAFHALEKEGIVLCKKGVCRLA